MSGRPKGSNSVPGSPTSLQLGKKKYNKAGERTEGARSRTSLQYGEEQSKRRKKLYGFSAREVAEEMTLLDAGLLRHIKTSELENGAWMKKDKVGVQAICLFMVKLYSYFGHLQLEPIY